MSNNPFKSKESNLNGSERITESSIPNKATLGSWCNSPSNGKNTRMSHIPNKSITKEFTKTQPTTPPKK